MPYVLGVDIGGAATTAATSRLDAAGWSPPALVRFGSRTHAVPSVLHLSADGSLAVGDPVSLNPEQVARGFVRRVGDDVPLIVGGEPCPPQLLTAVLVGWVVELVAAREGEPAEQVVVSHPAAWGPYRRGLLRQALGETGLAWVTLLPEPVVAAESYAAPGPAGEVRPADALAVYSLGGNEFEASVVGRRDGSRFRLLARTSPVDQFGGADIDEALAGHVQAKLRGDFLALRRSGPQARLALYALRRECVRAKERLSSVAQTDVPVPLPHGQLPVPVSRAELEELVLPLLRHTVDTLAGTVRAAGLRRDQLDAVLLVGGAARMPLVAELVAAELAGSITVEPTPRCLAATGAAVAASKIATPPPAPERAPAWHEEPAGFPPPATAPAGDVEPGRLDPPPRPPVTVSPLHLPVPHSWPRFGLVGGRR